MGLFGSKKPDENGAGGENSPAFSPEKARKFFEHAKTVHEVANYEYAVQSWLSGMRQDPTAVDGLLGFFSSLDKFLQEGNGKKGISKEVLKVVSSGSDLDKYLRSLLEWGQKPSDPVLAVRAFEFSAKLGLPEPAKWIGERALSWAKNDKKPRKDLLVKVCESFERIGVFDKAIVAAEEALKLDPSDGPLSAKIRTLAAQATMTKGGYDQAGQAGFRSNIRDAGKQRQLEEQDRIVQTGESLDRLVSAAEAELKSRPDDMPTREKLAKYLVQRGTPDDEERAHGMLIETYANTNQFRFRELAGDIRIRQARRVVSEAKRQAEERPGDKERMAAFHSANKALRDLEVEELSLRVEAYPTDVGKKYELGTAYFKSERFEDAIPMFQEAQGDPRFRTRAQGALAECFYRTLWIDEAIQTYRSALESRELSDENKIDLLYGLMRSLQSKAENERDLPSAEEAEKIASAIAIKSIQYRDIRGRREALKKLVQALKIGGGGAGTPVPA